jgi:hypothetical protein
MTESLLRDPGPRARLTNSGPFRFRLLQTLEPLIERSEPRVWWKLRDLVGFVLCHASPCASPLKEFKGQAGTRNMAESDTAKARPLYEGGWR